MSFLIESPDGSERCHVRSLEGYDDWTVIARGRGSRPREGCVLVDGRWVKDRDCAERIERHARFRAMSRGEMADYFDAELAKRDARIAALEQAVTALQNRRGGE